MRLRAFHLQIPGQWNDGWLYKEHLILWSRSGQMFVTELSELLTKAHAQLSRTLSVAVDYAIFRNDWKSSEQFRRLNGVEDIRHPIFRDFPQSGTPLVIAVDSLDMRPSESDPIPGFILDVSMYADHVYAGSSEGLFESRFDPKAPRARKPVVQRLENGVSAVNAKNSVVNSSAGEYGLFFTHVNFQDTNWWSQSPRFSRTADVSYYNSFATYHLLNYANKPFPTFLRAETEGRASRADGLAYQESRVVSYQDQTDISFIASAAINRSRRVKLSESESLVTAHDSESAARVLGNSISRLLIHWQDGLRVVDISAQTGRDIAARPDPKYVDTRESNVRPSSVLRTYAIESGFIVELFDEIQLITPQGSYVIAHQQAARIRTFVYSRRYQDIALVVGENNVTLIGFIESLD
jgi:hypothetical protein